MARHGARQGEVDYSTVEAILKWTEQHEIPLRGHNVFWGVPNMVQDWQKALNDDDVATDRRRPARGTSPAVTAGGSPSTT